LVALKKLGGIKNGVELFNKECMDFMNHEDVFSFAELYKEFISKAKTEREAVKYFEKLAKEKGFSDIYSGDPDASFYAINDNKNILLLRKGKLGLEHGINFVFAHIDSPRIDVNKILFMKVLIWCFLELIIMEVSKNTNG